jgi:hypothetical protein
MRCQKARKSISLALDGRLTPALGAKLHEHLQACGSCREWQEEQSWLQRLVAAPPALEPGPGLQAAVMAQVAAASSRGGSAFPLRGRIFAFPAAFVRPALLRAAALLVFFFSALFGLFLGARLESSAPGNGAAAFSQALNLGAFADLPDDSFGAVYERLLQGEIR